VSDGCRDKKDNGFKRIQAVRTPTDYNLHPIVRSPKADKCGPHEPHLEEGLSADRAAKTLSVKAPL
jgi:hypothetical protein